jgi:hypothetical protein
MWYRDGSMIVGLGGKCLDVQWGVASPGTLVHMWPCHGGPAQRWTSMPDGTLRGLGGFCLAVKHEAWPIGDPVRPIHPVHIDTCTGAAGQRWTFTRTDILVDRIYSTGGRIGAVENLLPQVSGFCFLQRLESMNVIMSRTGVFWRLSLPVWSAASVTARCVEWLRFANTGGYRVVEDVGVNSIGNAGSPRYLTSQGAIHVLRGVNGEFAGGGELVQVSPALVHTRPGERHFGHWFVHASHRSGAGTTAWAYSVQLYDWAGAPRPIRWLGRFRVDAPSSGGRPLRGNDQRRQGCVLPRPCWGSIRW